MKRKWEYCREAQQNIVLERGEGQEPDRVVCTIHGNPQSPRIAANGLMIAAAPELLKCARQWLEWMKNNHGPESYTQWAETEAAIAKAEGRL